MNPANIKCSKAFFIEFFLRPFLTLNSSSYWAAVQRVLKAVSVLHTRRFLDQVKAVRTINTSTTTCIMTRSQFNHSEHAKHFILSMVSQTCCFKNVDANHFMLTATSEGSIPMAEGEELHVIELDQGDGWTRVRRIAIGSPVEEGFVPTSYIESTLYA